MGDVDYVNNGTIRLSAFFNRRSNHHHHHQQYHRYCLMYHHLVDVNSSAIRLSAFFNGIFPIIVLTIIIIIIYTNSKAMSLHALSTVNFPEQSILDV